MGDDPTQVDELAAMYVAGKTMRGVVEHFDVHRTTVAIHLSRRAVQFQVLMPAEERSRHWSSGDHAITARR